MSNGATTLSLLALNEIFEVAFFTELRFSSTSQTMSLDTGLDVLLGWKNNMSLIRLKL